MQENVQCEQPWPLDVLEGNVDLQDSPGTTEDLKSGAAYKGNLRGMTPNDHQMTPHTWAAPPGDQGLNLDLVWGKGGAVLGIKGLTR